MLLSSFFFFNQKTAYEMRISDWSSDVCSSDLHATVMILGDVCTRACAFCNVKTGMPRKVDPNEPQNLADACAEMGLEHIVITSVDRDDLPDGGASQFVKVIEALRRTTPDTRSEEHTSELQSLMRISYAVC